MTGMLKDILVIEDNEELGALIRDFLVRDGYSVEWFTDAPAGIEFLQNNGCKLLLLDLMLPGMDGYEALQEIRKSKNMPVIMMSAKTDDQSKITGMEVGADDFLDKPFSLSVLSVKIKALMRRSYEMKEDSRILVYRDITLNLDERTVSRGGKALSITGKEFDILAYFMQHPETVIDKDRLFNEVWGVDCYSELSSLNVYIRWLREKLEEDPKNPELIQTVWRVGFKFGGK